MATMHFSEEIRMKSSSGGMFSILANYVLEQGGYVCGAAWDKNWAVHHIIVDNKKDLEKLRKSKYLQSRMEDCYPKIKKLLDNGNKVLFSGTPCQVAGLKNYLVSDYENLITVDLVCKATEASLQGRPNSPASVHFTGGADFTCYYLQDYSANNRTKPLNITSPVPID